MDRLANFRAAYHGLADRTQTALSTRTSNISALQNLREQILRFGTAAHTHLDAFPIEEYETLRQSVDAMLDLLDAECRMSEPIDGPTLVVAHRERRAPTGRPRLEFDSQFLAFALELRGPTKIASVLGCSPRTVRRRILDYGLLNKGECPFQEVIQGDGSVARTWAGTKIRTHMSAISDDQLDHAIHHILLNFPTHGIRMIDGHLKASGIRVSQMRIRRSFNRVYGPPPAFDRRRIERREYNVAGVNYLWHHDGQHGLIRWKLVTHAFIDGKSRLITAGRVHDNNRASTVLALFQEGMQWHGIPHRVRGDHGVENVDVARWMDCNQGLGTYIWGSSVHNCRIERTWVDYTQGVGGKWKAFFKSLEENQNLDPDLPAHIWLLHWLFLEEINHDLAEWINGWNHHKISLRAEPDRSPRDMFIFGLLQDGARGLDHLVVGSAGAEENAIYGIDWEAIADPDIYGHFRANNTDDQEVNSVAPVNPFNATSLPATMAEVTCEVAKWPMPMQFEPLLQERLTAHPEINLQCRDMAARRLVWQTALQICRDLIAELPLPDGPLA